MYNSIYKQQGYYKVSDSYVATGIRQYLGMSSYKTLRSCVVPSVIMSLVFDHIREMRNFVN